jgi:catechol 2,3-dioxygenase
VLDVDESAHFYADVIGLSETGRDECGRAYLKCWDEHDASSLVLSQAKAPGVDALAFKVRNTPALQQLGNAARRAGLDVLGLPEGDLLGTGERVRILLPTGHHVDLYAEKTTDLKTATVEDPPLWREATENGIGVARLDHCVLYGPHVERAMEILVSILGFYVTERALDARGELLGAWLSTSGNPADVAFVRHAAEGKLHHLAFRVESAEQVLRAADCFSMHRVQIDAGPFKDSVGRRLAVQAYDPSGNRIEVFWSPAIARPDAPPVTWSWKRAGFAMAQRDQRACERLFADVT